MIRDDRSRHHGVDSHRSRQTRQTQAQVLGKGPAQLGFAGSNHGETRSDVGSTSVKWRIGWVIPVLSANDVESMTPKYCLDHRAGGSWTRTPWGQTWMYSDVAIYAHLRDSRAGDVHRSTPITPTCGPIVDRGHRPLISKVQSVSPKQRVWTPRAYN